jgi:hypothetical protein
VDPELWLALCSSLAAAAAAVFAFVQAKSATDSRREARDAEKVAVAARDAALEAMRAAASSSALAAAATAAGVDVKFGLMLASGDQLVVVVENTGATVFVHGFTAFSVGIADPVIKGTTHWMPVNVGFSLGREEFTLPKRLHVGESIVLFSRPPWLRPPGSGSWVGISGLVHYNLDGGPDLIPREVGFEVPVNYGRFTRPDVTVFWPTRAEHDPIAGV